jgi:hypothetical protein
LNLRGVIVGFFKKLLRRQYKTVRKLDRWGGYGAKVASMNACKHYSAIDDPPRGGVICPSCMSSFSYEEFKIIADEKTRISVKYKDFKNGS